MAVSGGAGDRNTTTAEMAKSVTGITGGTAGTVVAAHSIEGGVANSGPQYKADKISNTTIEGCQGVTTVGDISGQEVNITNQGQSARSAPSSVEQSKPKGIKEYTVKDIEELLKRESFPDPVIKKFVEHGIDGKYFMNLHEDELLVELDVKTALLKMKVKTLIKSFS